MSCSTRPETLRTGDLLFVGTPSAEDDGIAAGAITASVGRGEMSFIHVAILEVLPDTAWVIDATMKRGVDRHPLDTLIRDFTSDDGVRPVLVVKRMKAGFRRDFFDRAKSHLGEPYDFWFMPGNGKMKCSEHGPHRSFRGDGCANPLQSICPLPRPVRGGRRW